MPNRIDKTKQPHAVGANVFISAHGDYYPPPRVPEYWDWLAHQAEIGTIKVPQPIWNEIKPHDEDLMGWLKAHQNNFILDPDESDIIVPEVLAQYGNDLTEGELEQIGADTFLVAAALHHGAVVVTKGGLKAG